VLLTRREFFKISVRAIAGAALATSDTVFVFPSHAHHSPEHAGPGITDPIAMLGTGSQGAERLWDGEPMQAGIHLRWFFDTSEGFPDSGFELFRRPSGKRTVVSFGKLATRLQATPSSSVLLGAVTFSSNLGVAADPLGLSVRSQEIVQLKFNPQIWHLHLGLAPVDGKTLFIRGSGGGRQFVATNIRSTRKFEFSAPVHLLEISGEGRITLLEFDTRDPETGWQRITRLCLPITDPQYPCRHNNATGTVAGDEKEAKARLPQTPILVDRYISGSPTSTIRPFRDGLHPELVALGTHRPYPTWAGKAGDPTLKGINHEDYLLLFSLNPYIARILGLYYVDREVAGTRASFDYKVDGKWLAGQLQFWDMPDIHGTHRSAQNGFTLRSTASAQVQRDYEFLIFSGSSVSVELLFPSIGIWQATVLAATAALPQHGNGEFFVELTFTGGRSERRPLPRSLEAVVFRGRHITKLRITGSGILLLRKLDYRHETGEHIRKTSAYEYQLSSQDVRHVASPPEGLSAWELKGWGATPAIEGYESHQNAVGLHWIDDSQTDENGEVLDSPLMPLTTIEWHDFKRSPSESPPPLSGREEFAVLNEGHPALARMATRSPKAAPQGHNTHQAELTRKTFLEFLITGRSPKNPENPQPPVDVLRKIHAGLKDGWYGYRARGVDFFGRTSAPSAVSTVRLANQRRPRPPILLEARYLQQNDPKILRTKDEDEWLASHPGKNGLRVQWAWLPSQYHDSPKALAFKIYGPTIAPVLVNIGDPADELSGTLAERKDGAVGQIIDVLHLKGTVTSIEQVGKLAYRLTTDASLEDGQANLFTSAAVLQETRQYQILEHTDGPNIVFLVESPLNENLPSIGPFILNHSFIKTSVVLHKQGNLLIDGLLKSNSMLSHVVALIGRSNFLVRHDAANPTIPPAVGQFSVSSLTGAAGLQATILSFQQDSNTQTLKVHLGHPLRIPRGNMLVGGVIEMGSSMSFRILENTATDAARIASITVRSDEKIVTLSANCTIKAPTLFTLHADQVLPGMFKLPRKMGGFLESGEERFQVFGLWSESPSAFPSTDRSCFLVTQVPGVTASPAIVSSFTYFPSYEEILEAPVEVSDGEIINAPVPFSAIIKRVNVESQSRRITLVTDREVEGDREAVNTGVLQSQGHSYKVIKVMALVPLTLVIESPGGGVPLPTVNLPCTISGKMPGVVVLQTNKAGTGWRWFSGGELEQGGHRFQVVGSLAAGDLLVLRAADGSAPVAGPFTYRPVSAEQPVNQGLVGVTAVDPHGESSPSTALAVTAVYRAQLPTPTLELIPPASGCLLAEPADWYGQSAFVLSWTATPGQMFRVYRAMDESLYELDRSTREKGPRKWAGGSNTISMLDLPPRLRSYPGIRAAIQADFNDLDLSIEAWKSAPVDEKSQRLHELEERYRKLRNDSHEILVNQLHVSEAFVLLTEKPLHETKGAAEFRDELPGRSSTRFFYRIQTIDSAGNTSEVSRPSPPVCSPDVTPPNAPVISRVFGSDRSIVLCWRSNREKDLYEYRVYRAESSELAADTRLMDQVANISELANEPLAGTGEIEWRDRNIAIGRPYWYRIVAVDKSGTVSLPSTSACGQGYRLVPPLAPNWVSAGWKSDHSAIRLEWSSNEPGIEFLLERRFGSSARWRRISQWLSPDTNIFEDITARPSEKNYYRIKSRDHKGNISSDFVPKTVPPVLS
jgi:hypothetical protein